MRRRLGEPLVVFVVVLAVYLAVTPRTNMAYRHFVYMAQAFLEGRTDLRNLPAYYHDVIRIGDRVYAPFPPVPAVILLPVVAVHGERTDQGRVGQILSAAAVAIFVAGLRRLGFGSPVRWFAGAALAFGSVLWPAAAIGTTWFFAQEVVVLATALLVWELAGGARPLALGALVTAAWLTRLSMLPAVPVLALVVWRRHRRARPVLTFLAANGVGVLVYLTYNYLRFGDPLQSGYPLLSMGAPNAEAAARWGFFHLRFVPEHLYAMLFRAPELVDRPPFLRPSPWGMSLVFTSPVIVRLLFPQGDRRAWWPWAVLVASLAIPMLPYFSVGWVQFGYRYSLDWWAFLLVMLASALGPAPRTVDLALLAAGIAMNALGTYWVRELGW
ncbi:MAG: hypothetical protein QN168_00770 [Armatimonadota bacterium]|nr:hypothetical protein [Armatimonadota bacterium]